LLMSWLQNPSLRALGLWAAAFALGALGVALIAAQGKIPNFWSILIANAILAAAYGILWTGVRSFEGRPTSVPLMLAGTMVWVVACQFEAFYDSRMARTALTSAIFVAYSLLSAAEIWRGREEKLNSRWAIIIVLLGNVLFFLIRIPLVGSNPSPAHPGEISVDLFGFIIFETILYAFFVAYMFGLMASERIAHRYRQASLTDPLTGISNRRDFLERCEALLRRSNFERCPSVVLLLDVDSFKSVNDTYGHHAGDQVLLEFSRIVASVLRPNDAFGRLGGEEFGCLIPHTSLKEGRDIAERIRARSEATLFKVAEDMIGVTVSVGVAVADGPDQAFTPLMLAADDALYRAKANGRNRVECAPVGVPVRLPNSSAA
jgi:diguanylate cyclase (GGDEF)-like protein